MDELDVLTGRRSFEAASLRLRTTTALPKEIRDSIRELVKLEVPVAERKKGYAGALLASVCAEADKADKMLMVFVQPFGDIELSRSQLEAWYRRFGFVTAQEDPMMMVRAAGSTPRMLSS